MYSTTRRNTLHNYPRLTTETCIFCAWTRSEEKTRGLRFYNIPREPGLKKAKWLQSIGCGRKINNRDRVCSVHFQFGRPSNDPSHIDFQPHLFLDRPPNDQELVESKKCFDAMIRQLQQEAERRRNGILAAPKPPAPVITTTVAAPVEDLPRVSLGAKRKFTPVGLESEDDSGCSNEAEEDNTKRQLKSCVKQVSPPASDSSSSGAHSTTAQPVLTLPLSKRVKLVPIPVHLVKHFGLHANDTILIRRKIPTPKLGGIE